MNIEMAFLKITGWLAAEIAAVVLIALISEAFVRSAQWRRTIWQVCAISVLLVAALELSGVGRTLGDLFQSHLAAGAKKDFGVRWLDTALDLETQTHAELKAVSSHRTPKSSLAPADSVAESHSLTAQAATKLRHRQVALVLSCAWILGTVLLLGRLLLLRTMMLMMCRRSRRIEAHDLLEIVEDLAPRLGIRGTVQVMKFPRLKGPIAFGLARRIIGLPPAFEHLHSRAQQEVILAHELAHLAAHDSWWQLVADLATAIAWWHPLVWLARRRLREASETAADESSVLIQNGPPVLAECLLALGKGMQRKPGFGWLNIGGEGFRSGLGRRVQRLFALNACTWKPASRTQSAIAKIFCPAALVLGTVLCSGWLSPGASTKGTEMKSSMWKRSLPAFALVAFLGGEQQSAPADKSTPPTTAVKRTESKLGSAQKGKGAALVRRKLEEIVFPNVQFDNLPLGAVINMLIDESDKRDPEGVGVNLLLNPFDVEPASPPIDPATGLPIAGSVPESVDLNAVTVRIMPPIKNIRLIDVLDAIVKMSDRPLKYTIEDYGVVITLAKRPSTLALETRTFVINPPESFYKGIQSAFGIDVPAAVESPAVRSREAQQRVFQELFAELGVEWGAPRSIFFNELNGIVMVRAAQEDMALISAAMETLGATQMSSTVSFPPNPAAKVAK